MLRYFAGISSLCLIEDILGSNLNLVVGKVLFHGQKVDCRRRNDNVDIRAEGS